MTMPEPRDPGRDGTRARILDVGLRCFAQEGWSGATTRMIASGAGVTLPVISYHFGNKEGLHRACAEAIVEAYRAHKLPLAMAARTAADAEGLSRAGARGWLQRILESLVAGMSGTATGQLETAFVLRELSEPGPGYELLLNELWKPGILLVADLIAAARGLPSAGEAERAAAMMLLASLTAYSTHAPVTMAILGWQGVDETRRQMVAALAGRMLDGILADPA